MDKFHAFMLWLIFLECSLVGAKWEIVSQTPKMSGCLETGNLKVDSEPTFAITANSTKLSSVLRLTYFTVTKPLSVHAASPLHKLQRSNSQSFVVRCKLEVCSVPPSQLRIILWLLVWLLTPSSPQSVLASQLGTYQRKGMQMRCHSQ